MIKVARLILGLPAWIHAVNGMEEQKFSKSCNQPWKFLLDTVHQIMVLKQLSMRMSEMNSCGHDFFLCIQASFVNVSVLSWMGGMILKCEHG